MHFSLSKILLVGCLLGVTLMVNVPSAQADVVVPFNSNSIWNKPIPPNPQVAPNSAQMIQYLMTAFPTIQVDGTNGLWSVPVYTANSSSPVQKICDPTGAHPCISWPVPVNIIPTPDGDGKMAIVDPATQRVFSGWQFKAGSYGGGKWTVGGGALGWSDYSSRGDGIKIWEGDSGGRVSLWNYYAGLIYPEEIKQGHIDHALHINTPAQVTKQGYLSGGFVWPAFHSDGQSTSPYAVPVGAHFQLDPSVNVDALNLSPGAKVVAKALQKYGAWLGDTGSLTSINAVQFMQGSGSTADVDPTPWEGLLASNSFYNNFPMDKMRIIVTNPSDYYVEAGSQPPPPASPVPTRSPSPVPSPTPVIIPSPVPTPSPLPSLPPSRVCQADINRDGSVNLTDYSIFVANFLKNPVGDARADINSDGTVNLLDYSLFVPVFFQACTSTQAQGTTQPTPSSTTQRVTKLDLINSTNGQVLQSIGDNQILAQSQLINGTLKFNASTQTKSVKWTTQRSYNNTPIVITDDAAPFTIVCDFNGGYCPWNVGPGTYTITADGYSQTGAQGSIVETSTVSISVQ